MNIFLQIYLIKGKTVPFLLRDLIATSELELLLGKTLVSMNNIYFIHLNNMK